MNQELTPDIWNAIQTLRRARLDTNGGMPQELFLLVSSLIPIPNVDLLVTNEKNQILLSWRDDPFYEKSWHIPGGCLRYAETMQTRVQQTALNEFGCEVEFDSEPVAVRDVIRGLNKAQIYPRERGHTVAVLYRCTLKGPVKTCDDENTALYNGCLRWFDNIPKNFMKIQNVYRDVLHRWC